MPGIIIVILASITKTILLVFLILKFNLNRNQRWNRDTISLFFFLIDNELCVYLSYSSLKDPYWGGWREKPSKKIYLGRRYRPSGCHTLWCKCRPTWQRECMNFLLLFYVDRLFASMSCEGAVLIACGRPNGVFKSGLVRFSFQRCKTTWVFVRVSSFVSFGACFVLCWRTILGGSKREISRREDHDRCFSDSGPAVVRSERKKANRRRRMDIERCGRRRGERRNGKSWEKNPHILKVLREVESYPNVLS